MSFLPDTLCADGRFEPSHAEMRDDVAYEVDGRQLCVVHLTYRAETDPRWPSFVLVDSLEDDEST